MAGYDVIINEFSSFFVGKVKDIQVCKQLALVVAVIAVIAVIPSNYFKAGICICMVDKLIDNTTFAYKFVSCDFQTQNTASASL